MEAIQHDKECYMNSGMALPGSGYCTCGAETIAALEARVRELEMERDKLREAYATETQRLQARIRTLEEYSAGNVWHWSAMDENHVESLTCPILISAEDMRAALKG